MQKFRRSISILLLAVISLYQVSCTAYRVVPVNHVSQKKKVERSLGEERYVVLHQDLSMYRLAGAMINNGYLTGRKYPVSPESKYAYDQRMTRSTSSVHPYKYYAPVSETHIYLSSDIDLNGYELRVPLTDVVNIEIYNKDNTGAVVVIIGVTALLVFVAIVIKGINGLNIMDYGW